MAGFGTVEIYREDKLAQPQEAFIEVCHLAGIDHVSSLSHCPYYFSEWKKVQEDLDRPFSFIVDPCEGDPSDFVRGPMTIEDAAEYFQPGGMLSILGGHSTVGHQLFDDVIASIPREVLGIFAPGDAHVRPGWHDLYEAQYAETARLHATAFLSISFSGNGYPPKLDECRKRIFAIPVMQSFRKDLEKIIGPVQMLMLCDI